jgi:hypothetical protein
MSYLATVIPIMITSPNDVTEVAKVARDVIEDWNAVHSIPSQTVLLPVGWQTDVAPAMGAPAQEVINNAILERADLLVALFINRLGTRTAQFPSGSVEEIERHTKAGKPAMVYFAAQPNDAEPPDEQAAALRAFRTECQQKGMLGTFSDKHDFQRKFARDLGLKLEQDVYLKGLMSRAANTATVGIPSVKLAPAGSTLSDESQELLVQAALDSAGIVGCIGHLAGTEIFTNGKKFGESSNPRSVARWKAAIRELVEQQLLEPRGYKGEVFGVTDKGYRLAKTLSPDASSTTTTK